ncbi:universal stress protein [Streptomyces sp. AB3(2024)]|uniref:universal stress protein n=1 Tax=Streptomyces sp. AB3(2024) TaxID=3317321 RepID=UPI0035A3BBF6
MDHRITVGLDGSPESGAAARWAAREAALRGAELRLFHAEGSSVPVGAPAATSEVRRGWAEALLQDSAEALHHVHPELRITRESFDGPPAASLATAAASADLLVLGSRGLGTLTGFVLGSVAMAVLHSTGRPVVLVRGGEGGSPRPAVEQARRDVVVGVDISRPCDAVLAFAFEEAARRSCRLHVLYAWPLPVMVGYGGGYDPRVHAEINENMTADLAEVLGPWRDRFPAVDATARTPMGRAAQKLVDRGAEAGLIVVGRRIRRSPFGAHIGSTTHAVIHHALTPVAVIAHD